MSFEEMVVAIVATVGGIGIFGFIIAKVTGLIKSWIERDKGGYDEETFNRLAKAFMENKKDTDRRLENLEAIIADEEQESSPNKNKQLSEPNKTIEIEDEEEEQEKEKSDGRNLRNMLRN